MSLEYALLSLIVILCLSLAFVSSMQGDRTKGSRPFAFMAIFAAVWAVVTFFEEEGIPFHYKPALVSLDFSLALLISYCYLNFSALISRNSLLLKARFSPFIILPSLAAIVLLVASPVIVKEVVNIDGSAISLNVGSMFVFYALLLGINFLWGTYALFRAYSLEKGVNKTQLLYVAGGLVVTIVITLSTNLVLPQVFELPTIVPRLGIYSMSIFLIATTFAITKHGLFSIKVIATQLFVALLVLALLGRALTSDTLPDLLFETVLLVLSSIFGAFLIRSVREEVSRREEIEKLAKEKIETLNELEERNKNLRALQEVSTIVLNENEIRPMTQKILDQLPSQLEHCIGAFVSIVKDGKLSALSFTETQFSKKINQYVGEDIEKYTYPIDKDFNALHLALVEHKVTDSDHLSDFISPPIPKPVALALQKLIGAQHMEAIPLYAGGEAFGVMLFVFSAAKERIHEKNMEIAKSIADEVSLAVQRAQAFQKLKDANEYLAELDKMKDEFISMASHELNTPLAAIEGYLSMILDEGMGKVDAKSREYLSRAYASSKRLAELILDLLNVSRIEQGRLKMRFSEANMAELAQSVIHELQIKADSKKIYLKLESDSKKPPVTWCDPDRIREVIVNLTGNALKFTEKGGVTIKIEHSGKMLRISVVDTGRGIAEVDQKKLFQKFSQIKREVDEHQGTGLGLYISKNFVELHKGKLWVESQEGKGATFIFEIPVLTEAPTEVGGAILERPLNAPKIESGPKDVPAIIAESTKVES